MASKLIKSFLLLLLLVFVVGSFSSGNFLLLFWSFIRVGCVGDDANDFFFRLGMVDPLMNVKIAGTSIFKVLLSITVCMRLLWWLYLRGCRIWTVPSKLTKWFGFFSSSNLERFLASKWRRENWHLTLIMMTLEPITGTTARSLAMESLDIASPRLMSSIITISFSFTLVQDV